MGRATRWLRGLLGRKKEGKGGRKQPANGSTVAWEPPSPPPLGREKKRPSFTKQGDCNVDEAVTLLPECLRRRRAEEGCHRDQVRDDRSLAVAAAAAEVVRLTTSCCGHEWWAAVGIQTAFRGFLARKALRALKALVKLQALVRGYLVRKQAAATLHCMEALIRAQVTVRMHRAGLLPASSYETDHHRKDNNNMYLRHCYPPETIRPRRSLERLDDTRSDHATASFHSRRPSANLDHYVSCGGFDDSPKIVEVDPGRPKTRNLRAINVNPPPTSLSMEDYSTTDETPRSRSSPLAVHVPPPVDHVRVFQPHDVNEWELDPQCHRRFPATAHSTPRLPRTSPAKSASGWSDVEPLGRWRQQQNAQQQHDQDHRRFMAGTQSSKAKMRSQSAPKQRPDPRRRLTLHEMVEARASLSGVRMQRSCSRAQQEAAAGFKGTSTAAALPRSCELGNGSYDRYFLDHHLQVQRRW